MTATGSLALSDGVYALSPGEGDNTRTCRRWKEPPTRRGLTWGCWVVDLVLAKSDGCAIVETPCENSLSSAQTHSMFGTSSGGGHARGSCVSPWGWWCVGLRPGGRGQKPPAKPKVRIEFHWAEEKPVDGVTEGNGSICRVRTRRRYLHKKAVLANGDIARADIDQAGDKFFVMVHLTEDAGRRMAGSSMENLKKSLVVLVDGKVAAAMSRSCNPLSGVIPVTGYSTKEAERIVEEVKVGRSGPEVPRVRDDQRRRQRRSGPAGRRTRPGHVV